MIMSRHVQISVLSHVLPQGRYLPDWEVEVEDPKQHQGTPGSPAKLWRLSRPLYRAPDHVVIITGCRAIPAERMGIHPIFTLLLTQHLWMEI